MKSKQKGSSSKESHREGKLPMVPVPLRSSNDIVIPSVKSWSDLYATDNNSLDPSLNSFVPLGSPAPSVKIRADGKVRIDVPIRSTRTQIVALNGQTDALDKYQHTEIVPAVFNIDQIRSIQPVHRSSGAASLIDHTLGSAVKPYKVAKREQSLWGDEQPESTLEAIEEMLAQRAAFEEMQRLRKLMGKGEGEDEDNSRSRTVSDEWSQSTANTPSGGQRHHKRHHRGHRKRSKDKDKHRDKKRHHDGGGDDNSSVESNSSTLISSTQNNEDDNGSISSQTKLTFRDKAMRQQLIQQNVPLSPNEKEEITYEINSDIAELAHSEIRMKLRELAMFINRHTGRKLVQNWNMIEMRFKAYLNIQHKMLTMQPLLVDSNGVQVASHNSNTAGVLQLTHPMKYPAMSVSQLVTLLCSNQVKIIQEEMIALLESLNIPFQYIELGRRIAALQLLHTISLEEKSMVLVKKYKQEIEQLMQQENKEYWISNIELLTMAVAKDAYSRNLEIEFIKGNKQAEANKLVADKRKRDEQIANKTKQRQKIMHDYLDLYQQLIIFDHIMTEKKLTAFEYMIKYCERVIINHYMDQSDRIPLDIASYIGIDAFPVYLQEKLHARIKKLHGFTSNMNRLDSSSMSSKLNAMTNAMTSTSHAITSNASIGSASSMDSADSYQQGGGIEGGGSMIALQQAMSTMAVMEGEGKILHEGKYIPWEEYVVKNLITDMSKHTVSIVRVKLLGTKLVPTQQEEEEVNEVEAKTEDEAGMIPELKKQSTFESLTAEAMTKEESLQPSSSSLSNHHNHHNNNHNSNNAKRMTIVYTLKEYVSLGKIFPGFSYRDTVEILQYIAATKIGALIRMFNRHWRYEKARYRWTIIFGDLKNKYYHIWMRTVRYHVTLRKYCLRKLMAWKYFIKRKLQRQQLFKQCFWPFHTWRKCAAATATAKEKAKFLVTRVYPTVLKIVVFSAWKKYALWQQAVMKRALQYYRYSILYKYAKQLLLFWLFKSYQRRQLRLQWQKYGAIKERTNLRSKVNIWFQIWKYASYYRIYYEGYHLKHYLSPYKSLLLYHYKKPFANKLSLSEKRLRISSKRGVPMSKNDRTALESRQSIEQLAQMKQTGIVGSIRRGTFASIEDHHNNGSGGDGDDGSVNSANTSRASSARPGTHRRNSDASSNNNTTNTNNNLSLQPKLVLQEIKRKLRHNRNFHWKYHTLYDRTGYLDIDSDGEDDEDLPQLLINVYHEVIYGHKETTNMPFLMSANRLRGGGSSSSALNNNNTTSGSMSIHSQNSFSSAGSSSSANSSVSLKRKNSNVLTIRQSVINRHNPLYQISLAQLPIPVINPYYRLHSTDLFALSERVITPTSAGSNSSNTNTNISSPFPVLKLDTRIELPLLKPDCMTPPKVNNIRDSFLNTITEEENDEGGEMNNTNNNAAKPRIDAIFNFDHDNDSHSDPPTPRLIKQLTRLHSHNPPPPPIIPSNPGSVQIATYGMFDTNDYFVHKVSNLSKAYQYREIWNLFESSHRYYKFISLAFTNLRIYAKIKHRVKQFQQKRRFESLQFTWMHWISYVQYHLALMQESKQAALAQGKDGTINRAAVIASRQLSLSLYHTLKTQHQSKQQRMKVLAETLKKMKVMEQESGVVNSDHDDYYDEEKAARNKIRRLNQMDMAEQQDTSSSSSSDSSSESESEVAGGAGGELQGDDQEENEDGLTAQEAIASRIMQKKYAKLRRKFQRRQTKAMLKKNVPTKGNNRWAVGSTKAPLLHEASMKETNIISPQQRAATKLQENFKYQAMKASIPNVFQWETEDREIEANVITEMMKYSQQVKHIANEVITKCDSDHVTILKTRENIVNMIEKILTMESGKTMEATKRQIDYAEKFKIHAANYLINILYKIYCHIQMNMLKEETKVYFRAIRLPMLIKRSKAMLNRKKLMNWIRTCYRLIAISNRAHYYHAIRTKWILFNRWLKYLEKQKLNPTPDLLPQIRRRLVLHPDFHNALMKKGFDRIGTTDGEGGYYENEELQHSAADFQVIFSRWKMYTQENILFKLIHQIITELNRLKSLQKVFAILKNPGLNQHNFHHWQKEEKDHPSSFPIVRYESDLLLIIKRFIPLRKKQLPTRIKRLNQQMQQKIKNSGKNTLTFKKFMVYFQAHIMKRISTEQRLLFESFESRGRQEFVDVRYPSSREDPVMPPMMAKLEGKAFTDPHPPRHILARQSSTSSIGSDTAAALPTTAYIQDSNIPAGFRLNKIKFAMQIHNVAGQPNANTNVNAAATNSAISMVASVVLGWQIVWSAEGCREIESTPRGTWNAAGITIQEIIIPKDDFVLGVEYLYDGPTIVSIRLKLMSGNFTRWVGGRSSLSTLGVVLDCSMAPKEDFELDHKLHADEITSPALPFAFVIGFSGVLHNRRPTCLGLIVRKVKYQHIFSYHWVSDVIVQRKLHVDATGGAVKEGSSGNSVSYPVSMDGRTIPSNVAVPVGPDGKPIPGGTELRTDSLTISQGEYSYSQQNKFLAQQRPPNALEDISLSTGFDDNDSNAQVSTDEEEREQEGAEDDQEADYFDVEGEDIPDEEEEEEEEEQDGDESDAKDGQQLDSESGAQSKPGSKQKNNNSKALKTKRLKRGLRRFNAWKNGDDVAEPLSSSETQFFDVLRMRLTELMGAKKRAETFAKHLWTNKDLRFHPVYCKLLELNVISSVTIWFFNSLSRHLMKDFTTELMAMLLIRQARQWQGKLKTMLRKSRDANAMAWAMERSVQPWTGKHMLSPIERQMKKDYQNKITVLREQAKVFENDAEELRSKAQSTERRGRLLLPRITLSMPVYMNFKTKLSAARHKENLLELMTLDEIKNGLFGTNMKEKLLNKDQMEAIHASLRDKKIVMKDKTSLQRLIDDIMENEHDIQEEEEYMQHEKTPFANKSTLRNHHNAKGGQSGTGHIIPTTSVFMQSTISGGLRSSTTGGPATGSASATGSANTATMLKFLKKPKHHKPQQQPQQNGPLASLTPSKPLQQLAPALLDPLDASSFLSDPFKPSAGQERSKLSVTSWNTMSSGGNHSQLARLSDVSKGSQQQPMSRVKAQVQSAVAMSKSLSALPPASSIIMVTGSGPNEEDAMKQHVPKHMTMANKSTNKRMK